MDNVQKHNNCKKKKQNSLGGGVDVCACGHLPPHR
jgi:hypothetical protein